MAYRLFNLISFRQLSPPALAIAMLTPAIICAHDPDYMRMNFEKVPALEIKGEWDSENNVFIAEELEELPKERRPKFRGEIQKIDLKDETITVYGMLIEIDDETQFSDPDVSIKSLKVGQRVEVSCKVREKGNWEASKISLKNIKESNKIKGTITRISVDGVPPDTLEIHGIKIILTKKTDIVEPAGFYQDKEDILFGDLTLSKLYYDPRGFKIGDIFTVCTEYRHTTRNNTEFDLSENYDADNGDTEPEMRLEAIANFTGHLQTFLQVRLRQNFFFNDERPDPPSSDPQADITQLYLLARNIGNRGFALQVGRQDFDEPREWLFDEYLDAVRIYYYGMGKFIFDAAYIDGTYAIKDKYESWTDYFWQVRWVQGEDRVLGIYALARKDSDAIRNREPILYGARFDGKAFTGARLWGEISLLDGEDKGESLDAHAFDFGATLSPPEIRFSPSLTVACAIATGDKTGSDHISNEFRQTGYHDNTDYFGGYKTIQYYGELLDPELSNLIITTFAAGIKPSEKFSAEVIYHKYTQNQADDKLRSDLIDPPARPNEISKDIGWELDVVFGFINIWERLGLSWIFAIFNPGQSFAPRLEQAILNKFNIKINL